MNKHFFGKQINSIVSRPIRSALLGTVVAISTLSSAHAETFRMLANLGINDSQVQASLLPFIESVTEATGGEIDIVYNGPEVVPGNEQFQPVQAGAFHFLYTHPVYFNGITSVGVSIDATAPDPEARRSSGYFNLLDDHFGTLGMKLVAIVPTGTHGYQFILDKPLGEAPSLQGRKIRGNPTYQPVIEGFGGTVVAMPFTEVYTSLDRGVIDGASWGASGVVTQKWSEVAGYMARPTFGSSSAIILMNKDAFDSMSPELQGMLLEEGRKMELSTPPIIDALVDTEWAQLKAEGMQDTFFPLEEQERLQAIFRSGVWATASKTNPELVQKLRDLAVAAGISD
jgi:TRAP-type C4-dicarboxylate transport system substrate-binding protein